MLYLNARFNRTFRDLLRASVANWNNDVWGYRSSIRNTYVRRFNSDQAMLPYAVNNIDITNSTHIISEHADYTIADTIGSIREGDRVAVMIQNGKPIVIGVVGSGDEEEALRKQAQASADEAAEIANAAQEKAEKAEVAATGAAQDATEAKQQADAAQQAASNAQNAASQAGADLQYQQFFHLI